MKKRTKVIAIVAASVLLAGTATGAFAYWTATGGGFGSAQTTAAPTHLTVNQTTAINPIEPGGAPQVITGDIVNDGTSPAYVDNVVAEIASVDGGQGTCDATDFILANATMPVNSEIAVGTAVGIWSGVTIAFNDKPTAQDGCIGATVHLAYSID